MQNRTNTNKTNLFAYIAMFAALAYVSVAVLKIPNIGGFLTFDFKDVLITIAAMYFGPVAAVVISLLVPFFEFISFSGTGVYGLIMNVISSMTLSLTASWVYKHKKTLAGAFIALGSGVVATTAIMMVANLIITPIYTGMPVGEVAKLIPKLLLPFNFTKSMLNSALVLMLYKPLTVALKKAKLLPGGVRDMTAEEKKKSAVRWAIIFVFAAVIVVVSLAIILNVWHGELSFFDVFKQKN